jgi:oligo-1,6-glucosidase
MVFHFEHVEGDGELGKWTDQRPDLLKLKQILSKWQIELENSAWNSLYWDNHDQPRAVSRFGNDSSEFRELSAKMLATCLHMMKGTPYIYQGEELGMTNYPFSDISQFQDIESKNAYEELVLGGHISHERMMDYLRCKSRDNARTPMQWNNKEQAGFTNGTPWLAVNPNFKDINADQQIEDPDSVFSYYKKLIALRKKYDVIVYGDYELVLPEDSRIFAYRRSLEKEQILVICNFTEQEVRVTIPEIDGIEEKEYLIHNYKETSSMHQGIIRPYEAFAIYWKEK